MLTATEIFFRFVRQKTPKMLLRFKFGVRSMTTRCRWVQLNNPLYVAYHDLEWGVYPCMMIVPILNF